MLIYAPSDITIKKHKSFHNLLIKKGIAQYLKEAEIQNIKKIQYQAINESENIAKIIKSKFLKIN